MRIAVLAGGVGGANTDELIGRYVDALVHRGPDLSAQHVEPSVALGHRRLSIIDLSTGQQPLYNEDQSVCVVFNGEIYN